MSKRFSPFPAFFRAMQIPRYNNDRNMRKQVVGEHTANMNFLVMQAYKANAVYPNPDGSAELDIMRAVTVHDMAEDLVGDHPYLAKIHYSRQMKTELRSLETRFMVSRKVYTEANEFVNRAVHYFDELEALICMVREGNLRMDRAKFLDHLKDLAGRNMKWIDPEFAMQFAHMDFDSDFGEI